MWKDYFFFPKKQRVGILILLVILLLTVVARILLPLFFDSEIHLDNIELKKEFQAFEAEMLLKDSLYVSQIKLKKQQRDSLRLVKYDSVIALSELSSRLKFDSVEKYWANRRQVFKDSINQLKKQRDLNRIKLNTDSQLVVNIADTNLLFQIKGVRKFILRSLWYYSVKLGGYCSNRQFDEIQNVSSEELVILKQKVQINPADIQKMNVNKASVSELKTHPYINFYQAKDLYELRRLKGHLSSIDEIKQLSVFRNYDFDKILPYLSFSR